MSRIFSLVFFVIIFFKSNYLTAIENKIIVKVNNDIITSYDLKQSILTTLILANQEVNQNIVDQSKPIALKSLINSILKKNEIKKFNLSLKETELNNQLLKKIESENAYKIIEIDEIKDAPINYLKPVAEELA